MISQCKAVNLSGLTSLSDVAAKNLSGSQGDFGGKNRPCLGSFLSKIQGPVDRSVPPFVSLALKTLHAPWANPSKPYFYIEDGQLLFDDSFRHTSDFKGGDLKTLARTTAKYCRVVQLAVLARKRWHSRRKTQRRETATAGELGLDTGIYEAPKGQEWNDAWEITERLLVKMNEEVTDSNKDFFVVTLSNAI